MIDGCLLHVIALNRSFFSFTKVEFKYLLYPCSHSFCPPLAIAVQVTNRNKLGEIKLQQKNLFKETFLDKNTKIIGLLVIAWSGHPRIIGSICTFNTIVDVEFGARPVDSSWACVDSQMRVTRVLNETNVFIKVGYQFDHIFLFFLNKKGKIKIDWLITWKIFFIPAIQWYLFVRTSLCQYSQDNYLLQPCRNTMHDVNTILNWIICCYLKKKGTNQGT